ncbi:MAG: hypothetical protein ABIR06_23485 [Cyclobacteriaceae bacterium]
MIQAIGKEKIGVRISPHSEFNENFNYDEANATYHYIGKKLNELGIAYLHITDHSASGEPDSLVHDLRKIFKNTIILSGGYTEEKAALAIKNNHADLISFARAFIPNPDLVNRFQNKLPLNQPKFDLFVTPGAAGYADYPVFEESHVI